MSDTLLRTRLIRLASEHPEFRKDLLPLIKSAGCEKLPEGGMRDNCEKKKEEGAKSDSDKPKNEGKPWEKDKKEASKKQAGMAIVRKIAMIQVRLTQHRVMDGGLLVAGIMQVDFGSGTGEPIRFTAQVGQVGEAYMVRSVSPLRPVSGGGADVLIGLLQGALQEAFTQRGASLLGSAANDLVPEPELGAPING